jgi:hypothetical protein
LCLIVEKILPDADERKKEFLRTTQREHGQQYKDPADQEFPDLRDL